MNYQGNSIVPGLPSHDASSGQSSNASGQGGQVPFQVAASRHKVFEIWPQAADGDARQGEDNPRKDQAPHKTLGFGDEPPAGSNLEFARRLIGAVRRQFWLIALIGLSLSVLTLVVVLMLKPQYTATTLLAVSPSESRTAGTDAAGAAGPTLNIDGEVEIMKSVKVAQQVVRHLNLTEDPRFVPPDDQSSSIGVSLDTLKSLLPKSEGTPDEQQADEAGASDGDLSVVAAEALQKITNVRRRGLTNVIALDITIDNAKDAARLANAYADTYIEEQVGAKLRATGHTETALSKRVSELGEALRRSETQIKAFALAQASQSSDETTRRDVDRLQANIAIAAREASAQATRLRDADSQLASGNYAALGKTIAVPEIVLLDEQRRLLEQRLQRPTEGEADLANLKQRLELVNSQLQSVSNQNVEALRRQSETSARQLASLRTELEQTVQKSDLSTDISVQLFRLQQEATATRQLYQDYLGRLKAMAQQRNILNPDVYVVAEASVPPNRSFPPRSLLLVIGTFAGFAFAVGIGYLRDNYPQNIKYPEELEAASRIPNVGSIPNARRAKRGSRSEHPEDEIHQHPLSAYSEAIRRLGVSLKLTASKENGLRSLLVTSTGRRDGRSTIALSLARDASRTGLRVVVLDCDLRHPHLHAMLGLANEAGMSELLLAPTSVAVASVIQSDPHSSCSIITSGDAHDTGIHQALHSPRLNEIVRELETRFDLVIVDSSPIENAADALVIARHTDAILLIARSTRSRPADIRAAVQELSRAGSASLFTALNFAARPVVL